MNRRSPVPPSAAGWVVIAAAVAPVVIRNARPLVKGLAERLIKAGERLRQAGEEADRATSSQPEPETASAEPAPQAQTTSVVEEPTPAPEPAEKTPRPKKKPKAEPIARPKGSKSATGDPKKAKRKAGETFKRPADGPPRRVRRTLPRDADTA